MVKKTADKIKETFKKMNKADILNVLFGASNLADFAKTDEGKKIKDNLVGKIFGIGPNDEALLVKAVNSMIKEVMQLTDENEIKRVRKKVNGFLIDLDKNGYSRWWFRNVLAAMNKGDAKGENSAAEALAHIVEGDDFDDMVSLAGPYLIHKSYKKMAQDGWELVFGQGKFKLLVDWKKIPKHLVDAKDDFLDGLKTPVISSKKSFLIYVGIVAVLSIFVFFICY